MYVVDTEIAATPEQRATGLMFRQQMPDSVGMLFVFDQIKQQCFWMKNAPIPLTAAFVDDDGTIVNLADMKPQTTNAHCSARPVRFVLEMNQGWFVRKGIQAGFKLRGQPFKVSAAVVPNDHATFKSDQTAAEQGNTKSNAATETTSVAAAQKPAQSDELTRLRAEALASAQRVRELEEQLKRPPQQTRVGVIATAPATVPTQKPPPTDPFVDAVAAHTNGDFPRALKLFKTLAAKGDANAQVMLGNMYGSGQGTKQSHTEAVKWYRMAATKGNAFGQYRLGQMYDQGEGVKKDATEAAKWYRLAAAQGNMVAQLRLGAMLLDGLGVTKDPSDAIKWFQLAADQGNVDAELKVAGMYLQGLGVAQSFSEAAKWYRIAAEKGNVTAQYALGGLYTLGRGVNQDATEAVRWFQKAAAQGHAKSMEILAEMRDRERTKRDAEARVSAQMARERRRCDTLNSDLAEKSARVDKLDEMYAAQVARRPSDSQITLQRMGQNNHAVGLGGAFEGVGEAVSDAHAKYASADYDHQLQMGALRDQIDSERANSGCN